MKNLKACLITVVVCLICCYCSFGQAWTRVHSLPVSFCNNIIRFQDGGYLVCGGTDAYGPPGNNAMLVKTDSSGYWQWQVVLGGVVNEYGFRAIQNAGGDIFVVSSPFLFGSDTNGSLLTRLSSSGEIIWSINFNGPQTRLAYDITASGYDVVITGAVNNTSLGTKKDLFIMKLDTAGNTLWTKTYGGSQTQIGNCISNLSDGGFLVGGGATSLTDSTVLQCYAMRTDAMGDTLWTRYGTTALTATGGGSMGFYGCTQLKGDSLVTFTSIVRTYYSNAIATTYRMDGTLKYNYISTSLADGAYDVAATDDGGFMMAGFHGVQGAVGKLFKFSYTGNLSFTKSFYGIGGNSYYSYSVFEDVIALSDGSCVAAGYSSLFGNNNPPSYGRMLIMKTTPALTPNYNYNGIITASGSTSFCKGDSVTLTAMAGFEHHQWFWFGSNGSVNWVANSDTTSITVDSAGSYECIMWDDNGMSYSNTISVKASSPPDTVIYSTGPFFHCAQMDTIKLYVKSQPYTTYQWYLNGNTLPSTTNQIVPFISGMYCVRVANACDTLTSTGEYVDVNMAQQINLDTTVVHLPYLNTAPFSCTYHTYAITPAPGTTYAWYRNGLATGGTQATDSVNQDGFYYVTAQNVCGTSISNIVQVVYDTLKLTVNSTNVNACDNHNLYLFASNDAYYYEWYKNGTLVSQGSGAYYLLPGHVSLALLDTGYFYCRVTMYCNGLMVIGNTDTVYYAERHVNNFINYTTNTSCNGNPIALSAVINGAQYQWYKDSVTIPGATFQNYNATSTGLYSVNATLACGVMTSVAFVQFGPPDPAYYQIHYPYDDSVVCRFVNDTFGVYIEAVSIYGWGISGTQWQLNGVDIPGATNNLYLATEAGWYRFGLTNTCGLSYTDSFYIADNFLPDFQVTPANVVNICPGNSATLSLPYDSSYTYEWYGSTGLIPGSSTNTINVSVPSYYYAKVSSAGGCFRWAIATLVQEQKLPLNNILPFEPPFICDDSVKLSVNERYDYTYQWYKNTNPVTGATQKFYYATTGGDYSVRIYDSLSCYSDAQPLRVVDSLIGTVTITSNISIEACTGDSVVLSTASGYAFYQWYVNGSLINGATGSSIPASSSGNYSVEVTNQSGCSGQAGYNLAIHKRPQLIQQSVVPAQCSTASGSIVLTFDTNYVDIDIIYPDGSIFTSYGYTGYTNTIGNLVSGWYHITYHYANGGCPVSDSIYVPQINILTPSIHVNDTTACVGQTVYLNAWMGPALYSWSTGQSTSGISITTGGMYTVTITDTVSGCTGVDSVFTVIAPLPVININPPGPVSLCSGNSIVLDAGSGNYIYTWSSGQYTQTINTTASGLYIVTVTDTITTCINRDTVQVMLHSLPIVSITPQDTGFFCPGQPVTLHATPGFSSYLWTGGFTDSVLVTSLAGNYSVSITDSNGCTATDSVVLSSYPTMTLSINNVNPSCAVCCDGIATVMPAGGTAPFTYLWSNGANSQSVSGLCNGIYTVTVTDSNGCIDSSMIPFTVGTTEFNALPDIVVFPNPTTGVLYIKGNSKIPTALQIVMTDVCGRMVMQRNERMSNADFQIKLDVDQLSPGMYFLAVSTNENKKIFKVEKARL